MTGTWTSRKKSTDQISTSKPADALIEDGVLTAKDFPDFAKEDGFRAPQTHFIDNIVYDGREPNAYLKKFSIGLKGKDKV